MSQPNSKNSTYKHKIPLSPRKLVKPHSWSKHTHTNSFSQTKEYKLANPTIFNKMVQKFCHTYQKQGHFCLHGCVFCIGYPVPKSHRRENESISAEATTTRNETIIVSFELSVSESVNQVFIRNSATIFYVKGYAGGGGNNYSTFSFKRGLAYTFCMKRESPKKICKTKKTFAFKCGKHGVFYAEFCGIYILAYRVGGRGQREAEVLGGEVKLEPWRTIASGEPRYVAAATSL